MLKKLNSIWLAAIVLAAFFWLSYTAYQHDRADDIAYPDSSIQRLNNMSMTLAQKQAAVLQDLWHISDKEITKPITIFGD